MARPISVYLEVAPKRTFAVAADWPGWARSGRTGADALASLADYASRYARVVGSVDAFTPPSGPEAFEVVARLKGGATTEFGAPGEVPSTDEAPLTAAEARRHLRLLDAAWAAFDDAVKAAAGRELRRGPRGGGRDVAKMVDHVLGAEAGYLAKLGSKYTGPAGDPAALREAVRAAYTAVTSGAQIPNANAVTIRWPPRYFVRRAAWHVLDHAWEIEDRVE